MLSLKQKLVFSYALLIIIIIPLSLWSVYHFVRLGRAVNTILSNNYKSILAAENMKEALERQDSAAMFLVAGQVDKARSQFNANKERFSREFQIAEQNITEPGEDRIVADIRAKSLRYQENLAQFLTLETVPQRERTQIYFAQLEPAFIDLKNRLDDLLRVNQHAMLVANERALSESKRAGLSTAILAALALLLALWFSKKSIDYIVNPVVALTEKAKRIAEGDFSQPIEITSQDEIGALASEFNRMAARLRDLRQSDYWRILIEQKKSDAVIDSIYEPVIVTDARGRVTKINQAAKQLLKEQSGVKQGESDLPETGLDSGEHLLKAVQEAVAMQRRVAAGGGTSLVPIKVGGMERSYRLLTTPLRDPDGRLLGAVTILEDLTDLHELDRLKTEFITVASNKLRAPLHSLQLALHALIERYAREIEQPHLDLLYTAREEAEKLDEIMSDLSELSEIESGTRHLNAELFRPVDLVRQSIDQARPEAECKHISLTHTLSPDLPRVAADRHAMMKILDNLLTNAIRHTGRGGQVTVSAADRDTRLIFYVKDTGEGIAEADLPTVFGRFVHSKSISGGRTGLGLAIVKRLVESQGGQVSVESRLGEGTTFTFTLPVGSSPSPMKQG